MSPALFLCGIAAGILISAVGDRIAGRYRTFGWWWYCGWTTECTALSALSAAVGSWGWAAWLAVCAVINGGCWWGHCRRRARSGGAR